MNRWVRVVIALTLLVALTGLFVHEEMTEDRRTPYPDTDALNSEYESYVGQSVMVFGTVTDVNGAELEITVEGDESTLALRVTGVAAPVEPGGVVQVYGTIRPERAIAAERVEVVNSSFGAELYKYGASALGAVGFLVLFFRYWRVDRTTWTLEARDG